MSDVTPGITANRFVFPQKEPHKHELNVSGDLRSFGSNDEGTNEALSGAALSHSPPSVTGDRVCSPRIVLRDGPEVPVVRCTSRQCKKVLPPEAEN